MQKLQIAGAVLGTALTAAAQCAAGASAPPQTLLLTNPFTANFYTGASNPVAANYTGINLMFDLDATCDITLTGGEVWLYDQGAGNPVNPDQTGLTANINIYTCANTYTGNEMILPSAAGSPWTLAGTASVVVAAFPTNSVISFATPVVIPQGQYGVAFEIQPPDPADAANVGQANVANAGPIHTLIESPQSNPTPGDLFISISNTAVQNEAFVGATGGNDGLDLSLDYTPSAAAGFAEQFGDGCYFRPRGFYEDYPANGFDLSNTGFTMIPTGINYQVIPVASSTYVAPVSTSILVSLPIPNVASTAGSWDDALSDPITLPFSFPFVGGSTSDITISSNGSVFLAAVTDPSRAFAYYSGIADFIDFEPRIAAFFGDLDPSVAGGAIHYDQISATEVRITFVGVEEWGVAGATNNFQVVLDSSGSIQVIYQGMSQTVSALAGFTPGNGERVQALDLSTSMPFTSGDGAIPPVLDVNARPVLGQTMSWFLDGITPGTSIIFLVTGTTAIPTGIPLAAIGMPDCFQYINPQDTFFMNYNAGTNTATTLLPIPNNAAFLGANLFAQAAPFTSGLNAAGILTSNGACITVGAQ